MLFRSLDNVAALGIYAGHQGDMFGSVSDENMGRIKRQNERKISVIIGNPPYNANQQNENDNNKNRAYDRIDARIKQTYIKASTAQKTKQYDMYKRFFRWASDRLGDEGILAFITNRSFIDGRNDDGFRRIVAKEFSEGWVVDLGGDYKKKGVGGSGNVFGIGTGVAVSLWVKRKSHKGKMKLSYAAAPSGTGEDKLSWIADLPMEANIWQSLMHREDAAWVDIPDAETTGMLPIANKKTKEQEGSSQDRAIFKLYSLGVSTNRDEWLYSHDRDEATEKSKALIKGYDSIPAKAKDFPDVIKWSRNLKRRLSHGTREKWQKSKIVKAIYRPFSVRWLYQSSLFIDESGLVAKLFPAGAKNRAISFSDPTSQKPFLVAGVDGLVDLHFVGAAAGTIYTPRYRYTKSGERVDNITDWAVAQFRAAYAQKPSPLQGRGGSSGAAEGEGAERANASVGVVTDSPSPNLSPEGERDSAITKDAIFAYCYAVLHDPLYREKYALNLKREFPRIPFYPDFDQWVKWGEALLKLHIDYEDAVPFALTRIDTPSTKRAAGTHPKPKLKSYPGTGDTLVGVPSASGDTEYGVPSTRVPGTIQIDEDTQLIGIPAAAWEYRLGNRSAIDWVLDQHKEKTPRDPTIRAKFNTYRFADYKEACITLLAKVVRMSVETVAITAAMKARAE